MTTLMRPDLSYCEIIADDIEDPLNNGFHAEQVNVPPRRDRVGVQDEWHGKWDKKILTYAVIKGTEDVEKDSFENLASNMAMTMWDIEIEIDLILVSKDDNPDIRIYWKTSDEEEYFAERPSTLAFAFYPAQGSSSGIMVFNEDYFWNLTGKAVPGWMIDSRYPVDSIVMIRGYSIIIVMGHENGHMLGLTHSTRGLKLDLMDPIYYVGIKWPSEYDIWRMLLKYPREQYSNWARLGHLRKWFRRKMARIQINKDNYN